MSDLLKDLNFTSDALDVFLLLDSGLLQNFDRYLFKPHYSRFELLTNS